MLKKKFKSFAKINLFLNVGKKFNKTRLHNIQSLVCLINIHDKITVSRTNSSNDIIKFYGKFINYVNKKNNSVSKCLSLLRAKGIIKKNENYKIVVKKNIPVFSGFGGGSSNASNLIKYFTKYRKLNEKDISYFCNNLGSDCRLFFGSKNVFQKSLNKVVNIKKKFNFYFILIYPFLRSSTKDIYSKVKVYQNFAKQHLIKNNSKSKIIEYLKKKENSLEVIVIKKYPVTKTILHELRSIRNCKFSRVTGSGSACFGLFLTKKSAVLGLKKIKKKFPKFWCVIGKTI